MAEYNANVDVEFETETIGFSLIFLADSVNQITPYFRLGFAESDAEADFTFSGDLTGSFCSDNFDTNSGTWYGVGINIRGSDSFALNIEAARFNDERTGFYMGPQFYF